MFLKKSLLKFWRRHVPFKNKTIRADQAPYVTKTVRKSNNEKDRAAT